MSGPGSSGRRSVPLRAVGAACALLAVAAFALSSNGLVWACALGFVFCAASALAPGSSTRRGLALNAALLLLIVGVLELVWRLEPEIRDEGSALAGYIGPHDVLGYAPRPGHRTTITRRGDGETIYDVTYTIGPNGLRVAPPADDPTAPCVLFFGGSFTFGEGLEDDETLAWQFGARTGGRVPVHNFGFHGYGPHQMLAALQQGLVDAAIGCAPRLVVYQAGAFHVARAAGLSAWESGGPRFEVDADGDAVSRGRWDESRFAPPDWLSELAAHSKIVAKLLTLHRPPGEADRERFLAIVGTTARELADRYGAELVVVYWDAPDDPLAAALEARGLPVLRVSEAIPELASDPDRYRLHRLDGHPNARAMARLAEALAAWVAEAGALAQDRADADPR